MKGAAVWGGERRSPKGERDGLMGGMFCLMGEERGGGEGEEEGEEGWAKRISSSPPSSSKRSWSKPIEKHSGVENDATSEIGAIEEGRATEEEIESAIENE